jgi:SAM-dependent methyltransferase
MTLEKWSRSPKHILRMKCLDDVIKNFKPGLFLEIGAGNGDLTKFFLEKSFYGKCYDIGSQTTVILKEIFSNYDVSKIEVLNGLDNLPNNFFDYLFAFEVLEHIQDDASALNEWRGYLKKYGILLLSIPAHMKVFSVEDEAVGHYRRYEKNEIFNMLVKCGYKDIAIYNYGFPLGNITRKMSLLISKEKASEEELTMEQKTVLSGIERKKITNQVSFLINKYTLFPFIVMQRFFYQKDWGDGYVVYAKKI